MRHTLFFFVFLFGCESAGKYRAHDLQLATTYAAKEMCSCLFVMEQDETFCRNWTKAQPAVATIEVNFQEKSVTSSALLLWARKAHFVSAVAGCQLE